MKSFFNSKKDQIKKQESDLNIFSLNDCPNKFLVKYFFLNVNNLSTGFLIFAACNKFYYSIIQDKVSVYEPIQQAI